MISRQDPEYWRFRYEKRDYYNELVRKGLLGADSYLLSMQIAGFNPREARDELTLLKLERT
jgi:hypothetical protein